MTCQINPFNIDAFDGSETEVRQALFELQQKFALQTVVDDEDKVFSSKMEKVMEDIIEDIVETEEQKQKNANKKQVTARKQLKNLSHAELERMMQHEKNSQRNVRTKKSKSKKTNNNKTVVSEEPAKVNLLPDLENELIATDANTNTNTNGQASAATKKDPDTKLKEAEDTRRKRNYSKDKGKVVKQSVPDEDEENESESDSNNSGSSESSDHSSANLEQLSSSPSRGYKYAAYKRRLSQANNSRVDSSDNLPEHVVNHYRDRDTTSREEVMRARMRNKNKQKKKVPALSNVLMKGVMGFLPFRTSHLAGFGDV
jgi:hypothetical protein